MRGFIRVTANPFKRPPVDVAAANMLATLQKKAHRLHPLETPVLHQVARTQLSPGTPEHDWLCVIHTRLESVRGAPRKPYLPLVLELALQENP